MKFIPTSIICGKTNQIRIPLEVSEICLERIECEGFFSHALLKCNGEELLEYSRGNYPQQMLFPNGTANSYQCFKANYPFTSIEIHFRTKKETEKSKGLEIALLYCLK